MDLDVDIFIMVLLMVDHLMDLLHIMGLLMVHLIMEDHLMDLKCMVLHLL
jgi:hypothetical protein